MVAAGPDADLDATDSDADLDATIARIAATDDAAARLRLIEAAARQADPGALAERLKDEADRARHLDPALSLRWCDDVEALGSLIARPTIVALGLMTRALTVYEQGDYRRSLDLFDRASALFRGHSDEVGWARAQIGRIAPCMVLARGDEALQRGLEARAILEGAGDRLRSAAVDSNLAGLLSYMNRPAEALPFSDRAMASYRALGATVNALHAAVSRAFLLWRLGRTREALTAYLDARVGYLAVGAAATAARQTLNIGTVFLTMGRYAEAAHALSGAQRELQGAGQHAHAALAGLYLLECHVRTGRHAEALAAAEALGEVFQRDGNTVEQMQTLLWAAHAWAATGHYDRALASLDRAERLVDAGDGLAPLRPVVQVARARLCIESGRSRDGIPVLKTAITLLREAGLHLDAASAQLLLAKACLADGRDAEAQRLAEAAHGLAAREGLDWLAAQALHARGRAERAQGQDPAAWSTLVAAEQHARRGQGRVAWDDRAAFSGHDTALYDDLIALALRQGRPASALRFAELRKAGALADHLTAQVDIRPRARDRASQVLVDELAGLRTAYAALGTGRGAVQSQLETGHRGSVRGGALPEQERREAARIEQRMAALWRELQAGNPAYRGDAAALGTPDELDGAASVDEPEAARRWLASVNTGLAGRNSTMVSYTALGDDILAFVLRGGHVHSTRLDGAAVALRRLMPLLRLNVERHAAAASGGATTRALAANARGVLRQLNDALLSPLSALLDGVARTVVVPYGPAHHVPFQALYDGQSYAIERMEIAYAPCAGLLEHFNARYAELAAQPGRQDRHALIAAYAAGGTLPYITEEAADVHAAIGGTVLRDEQASSVRLRAEAPRSAILHLSAHAVFRPDDPLFSALHLSDGPLTTLDVFDLDLRCSLATLSACETALGVSGAGDELMGLSRAFLYAGASSLLLSLWKVEDRSTAALMRLFYGALARGADKAAALREAQLALLHDEHGSEGDWSAPYYWAPFNLIGHAGPL